MRYHTSEDFSLLVGPDPGFLIRAGERFNGERTNLAPQTRRFEMAFAVGAQLELQDRLELGARYTYGLMPILRDGTTDFPSNRTLRITLNYCLVSYLHRARTRGHEHSSGKTMRRSGLLPR